MNFPLKITTHPRSKNIRLSVLPNGTVKIVKPKRTPQFMVDRFINQQQEWIQKQIIKQQNQPKVETDTHLSLFGKQYKKHISSPPHHPVGVHIHNEKLIVSQIARELNKQSWGNHHSRQVELFLKSTASHYIVPRTHSHAKKMKIDFGNITLRKQKTRWGSCSSEGNLNFNWQLVHFEPKIIDYVIIHELAHRVHMNHSAQFWALVAKYDGNYKEHMNVLKKYSLR